MTSQIQVSGKSDSGVIFVVGGDGIDEFFVNLTAVTGDRESAEEILKHAASLLAPVAANGPAAPPAQGAWGQPPVPDFQQAQQNVANAFPPQQPAAPAAGEVFCGSHQRPAKVIQKKDGSGSFYKCPVNDSIISNWGKPGVKDFCPSPK